MKNNYLCAVFFLLAGNLFCQDEITDIKTLIMANDPRSNREITLLRKINMGIPGGDNWLVESTYPPPYGTNVLVYVINDGNIIKKENLGPNFNVSERTNFDIMKDIPGTRIREGSCVINDYNDDGFDEVFNFGFFGSWHYIYIKGYDLEKKEFVHYAYIPFDIIDRERGPSPAEFIIYKRMKGFKVYFFVYEVAGGPGWVPDPDPRNGKWIFYAWDEEQRKFVEIEEVEEDGIESAWPAVVKKDIVEWVWKPNEQESDELQFAEKDQYEEVSELTADDSAKNKRVNFYIIAITCAIILEVAIYIVRRRKR
jgi:hypothetical protein